MNCISGRQRQSTSSGVINCGVEVWEPQFVAERSTYLAAITTVTTCSSTSRRYCCELVLVVPVHVVVVCILLGFLHYLPVQYSNTLLQPYVLCNNPVCIMHTSSTYCVRRTNVACWITATGEHESSQPRVGDSHGLSHPHCDEQDGPWYASSEEISVLAAHLNGKAEWHVSPDHG